MGGVETPSLLFAKLEENCLVIEQSCIDYIQSVLIEEDYKSVAFITVLGPPGSGKTEAVTSMLKFYKPQQNPNGESRRIQGEAGLLGDDQNIVNGIMLLSTHGYKTVYMRYADGMDYPENAAIFFLDVRAPSVDADAYSLLVEFCVLLCSHIIYLEPSSRDQQPVWLRTLISKPNDQARNQEEDKLVTILEESSSKCSAESATATQDEVAGARPRYFSELSFRKSHFVNIPLILKDYWPQSTKSYDSSWELTAFCETIQKILHERSDEFSKFKTLESQEFQELLCNILVRCNQAYVSPALGSHKPEGFATNTQVKYEIRNAYRNDFNSFLLGMAWAPIHDGYLFHQYRSFAREQSRSNSSLIREYGHKFVSPKLLEEIVVSAFEKDLLEFKEKFQAAMRPSATFIIKTEEKLEEIFEQFQKSYHVGNLDDFLLNLPFQYLFEYYTPSYNNRIRYNFSCLSPYGYRQFNMPPEPEKLSSDAYLPQENHEYPKYELLSRGDCFMYIAFHLKSIYAAGTKLQNTTRFLIDSFTCHLQCPHEFPLPLLPDLVKFKKILGHREHKSIADFVEKQVHESYDDILQIYHFCLEKLSSHQGGNTERDARESAAILFRQKINAHFE